VAFILASSDCVKILISYLQTVVKLSSDCNAVVWLSRQHIYMYI
jgi:hypothetical protein